jgi:hypothetical protein
MYYPFILCKRNKFDNFHFRKESQMTSFAQPQSKCLLLLLSFPKTLSTDWSFVENLSWYRWKKPLFSIVLTFQTDKAVLMLAKSAKMVHLGKYVWPEMKRSPCHFVVAVIYIGTSFISREKSISTIFNKSNWVKSLRKMSGIVMCRWNLVTGPSTKSSLFCVVKMFEGFVRLEQITEFLFNFLSLCYQKLP